MAASELEPDGDAEPPEMEPPSGFFRTVEVSESDDDVPVEMSSSGLPPRYRDLGVIARGAMGEIRRVRDLTLDRVLAMKIMHAEAAAKERLRKRFEAEATLTANLQHPGIVAVHDRGELEDGRPWFTMSEVHGATFGEVIEEVHAAADRSAFRETPSGWTFRRLVDAFARICQAVAYAHSFGVVHRDLKPDNLMVGAFGQVLVMDWGLGRRIRDDARTDEDEPSLASIDEAPHLTRYGDVLGTPAYMPPEQARGQKHLHGPESDVYALGAILYHLLSRRPPYVGPSESVVARVKTGAPAPIAEVARNVAPLPPELVAICERAMQRDIADRYRNADALARDVVAWLDGAERREQALVILARARDIQPRIAQLRAEAAARRARAQHELGDTRPFDPIEKKRPAWALEDEATQLDVAATLQETEWLQAVHGAISFDRDLPEAHAMLAEHYAGRLAEAELSHREEDAARFETLLRAHHRGRPTAAVRGEGVLSLVTDPPGALVRRDRYERRDRYLVPAPQTSLGVTPLRDVVLPRGSYRLLVSAPGCADVTYPVLIERGAHWDGRRPGEPAPFPIRLPRAIELAPDDIYVPAGFTWIGGDREAGDSLPRRRVWVDAFILRRFPVTNREYLEFLNELVATGHEDQAVAFCPRTQRGMGEPDRLAFERDDGRFRLSLDSLGAPMLHDCPIVLVDWYGAVAYAEWLAARTGLPWRLPHEIEREKAARGPDGRLFPWGDQPEATFACVAESRRSEARLSPVHDFPTDESPYGVRGLAGNSRDWCANLWRHDGPAFRDERLVLETPDPTDQDFRSVRGGAWSSPLDASRSAGRFGSRPTGRRATTGFRLARSA